jgi:hypothetical protein
MPRQKGEIAEMKYALPLSLLLAASVAAPSFADDLSFKDLGPWAHGGLAQQISLGARDAALGRDDRFALPTTGTASYAGITRGTADITPFTTNVTAHDLLTGTVSLNVDFGTQSITGGLNNLTAIDPKTHATTPIGGLVVENPGMPFSGKSYTAIASTFSAYKPIGGQVNGRFLGPNAALTTGTWHAAGTLPESPTPTSSSAISMQGRYVAGRQ